MLVDIEVINRQHNRLAAFELAEVHRDWFREHASLYRPGTAAWIQEGRTVPPAEADAARAGRDAFREHLHSVMEDRGIDVWLSPAAPGPAPKGMPTGNPVLNLPWTYAGLPVATVPAGRVDGLPVGLQLAARAGHDARLAAFAAAAGDLFRD
jgi:Asp-tRNA(Asn)/Glu-tRNA(Gln) amidotransferase A subunit family amidase